MTITIIILAYVANVFLNRWLNKIDHRHNGADIFPLFWFFSLVCTLIITFSLIEEYLLSKRSGWFTGKHW